MNLNCYLCHGGEEIAQNLMSKCPYMVKASHAAGLLMHPMMENSKNWKQVLVCFFTTNENEKVELYSVTLYELWFERNKAYGNIIPLDPPIWWPGW